jgi:hypothetical protein
MSGVTVIGHRSRFAGRIGALDGRHVVAALLVFVFVVALAANDGGYFPSAWGWATLALLWLAALALILGEIRLDALDLAAMGSLFAVFAWTLVSALWTESLTRTLLESERALVYPAALAALLLLVRVGAHRALLGGTWAAITVISTYSLATRLFPERLGLLDPIAGYRLSQPIGYWNALGLFAAIGALIAVGVVARTRDLALRCAAAGSLLVLLPTLYFTFSRGAWIALAIGLAAAIALEPRRLHFVSTLLVVVPLTAVGLLLAYLSDALSRVEPKLSESSAAGHRLALALAGLAVANVLLVVALHAVEKHWSRAAGIERAYRVALALALVAGLLTVFLRYGGPVTLSQRGYDAFAASPPRVEGSLNRRLFNLSGSGRLPQWRVAWAQFEAHPWLGSGAGTYELAWLKRRPYVGQVRDAHNLYLETLTELGPVGLAFLVVALGTPLVAAWRARRHALVPAAFGAYVAFLVHAVVDWDWEIPAVTLAAVLCAAAMLVAARNGHVERSPFRRARVAAVAIAIGLGACAFVGLLGNIKLAKANDAADAGNWRTAERQARSARSWAPWSAEPWQLLAEAQLAEGRDAAAPGTFRKAVAKDPNDWTLWFGLAQATDGREQRRALAHARRLNPLSPEIANYASPVRKVPG